MSGATSATLGIAGLLVGGVLLAGALSISASAGQPTWRGLRPRWPVLLGVVVIALIIAGVGMAAAVAITSPDPQPGPVRAPINQIPCAFPTRCLAGRRRDRSGSPWW